MEYVLEYLSGGLGDVIREIYKDGRYRSLDHIGDSDVVHIVLISHNPFVGELFYWHPKAAQFKIHHHEFCWDSEIENNMKKHGLSDIMKLPNLDKDKYREQEIRFYPSQDDLRFLKLLKDKKYIVISANAAEPDKNIPNEIVGKLLSKIDTTNYHLVPLGRTYNRVKVDYFIRKIFEEPSYTKEFVYPEKENITNMIDKLSIPGTIEAIRLSSGVISCHSAVNIVGWKLRKPTLLLYNHHIEQLCMSENSLDIHKEQFGFGKDYPEVVHSKFSSYNDSLFDTFLGKIHD